MEVVGWVKEVAGVVGVAGVERAVRAAVYCNRTMHLLTAPCGNLDSGMDSTAGMGTT